MFPKFFGVVLVLFALQGVAPAQSSVTTKLELGKPIERHLAGTEVHSYQIEILSTQYAEVLVDQRGIDVTMSSYDPQGQKLCETNMVRAGGQEAIIFGGGEPGGTYRLEVRAAMPKDSEGTYEIKLIKLRTSTAADKFAVPALRLVAAGLELERKADADSFRKSTEKYQQALPLWHSSGIRSWEANALDLMAHNYMYLGEKQKALEFAQQALAIIEAASAANDDDERLRLVQMQGSARVVIGQVHNHFGDKKKALEYFTQALPFQKSGHDRPGELLTLSSIVMAYQYMGDYQKGLESAAKALPVAKELGDRATEATLLNNTCVLQENVGNYKQALGYCNQALALRREFNDRLGVATVLNNLGNVYAGMGDYQQALDFYYQSEEKNRAIENKSGQGIELNNIAWLYAVLGDYEKAIDIYNQSLAIFTAQDDQFRIGNVLNNLAASYAGSGDYKKALEIHLRVLPLRKAVNNNQGLAVTLNNIAKGYAQLHDTEKALDYYNQSLQLLRQNNPRQLGSCLRDLGNLYSDIGDQQKALASYNESLQVARSIGDHGGEAATLAKLAELERNRGQLAEAKRLTETALATAESLRVNLKSQQLRASFFASVRTYHELYIDVLMRMHQQDPSAGFDSLALQASENARARSLLELLLENNANIRQGVDVTLAEREQTVRQAISVKAEAQMRLLSAKDADAKNVSQELDALTNEYEQIQTRIRQTSPRYAALTQPVPVSIKEIQSQLLDENTVLLEYSLGEDRSFLWMVGRDAVKSYVLPKRAEVEASARRVYDLVTARDAVASDEPVEQLSRMLLGPAAAELKNKRLLIVAEGVLQYVPFSALSEPNEAGTPLMVKHEIVTLPSASVLSSLRRETNERVPASKSIAVFADPVFDTNDARVGEKALNAVAAPVRSTDREVKRSAEESGLANFPRLRFTREEANQIMKFAPRLNSVESLDFSANRAAVTNGELQNYRIVHFATHGIINSRHAELSGIVLSLVDREGKPQNGFLRLYDIYNLKLKSDLVVLSACQTALGRDIKGEGLIGLTRAFMYAGATRVVASLWQTDDRATAVLMGRFYEDLLGRGMSPASALRNAQISMWQDKRWHNPRYWAAFTIQGEWK